MSPRFRKSIAAAIAYAVVGVFSFGHAAAQADEEVRLCEVERKVNPETLCMQQPAFSGLGAAILWPLYWSWELQS